MSSLIQPLQSNFRWAYKAWLNGDYDFMLDRLERVTRYYAKRRLKLRLKLWLELQQ